MNIMLVSLVFQFYLKGQVIKARLLTDTQAGTSSVKIE